MPTYTQLDKQGKTIPFIFSNKKEEQEYIHKCELLWGAIPFDVNWARGTEIYKNFKLNE